MLRHLRLRVYVRLLSAEAQSTWALRARRCIYECDLSLLCSWRWCVMFTYGCKRRETWRITPVGQIVSLLNPLKRAGHGDEYRSSCASIWFLQLAKEHNIPLHRLCGTQDAIIGTPDLVLPLKSSRRFVPLCPPSRSRHASRSSLPS